MASSPRAGRKRRELWKIREAIVEAQLYSGSIKHDVSVPVSRVADFIIRATAGGDRAGCPAFGRWPSAMSGTAISTST